MAMACSEKRIKPNAKLITISGVDLLTKSNLQDFQRYQPVDIAMAGNSQTSLPALIEVVRAAIPADKKAAFEKRGEAMKEAWQKDRDRLRQQAALGWDASPISTARLCAETVCGDQGPGLVAGDPERQYQRLGASYCSTMDKHYRYPRRLRRVPASAMACRLRSVPRMATRRSAVSRCRSRATAT